MSIPDQSVPDAPGKILLFIPMYNCAAQIPRVLSQLTNDVRSVLSEVIIVDNRSTDDSVAAAEAALTGDWQIPVRILRNDHNYGLGGSHKVAFNYAIANAFDYCIVLHGDDQGSIVDLLPLILSRAHKHLDCLLGARFMRGSRLQGYSLLRTLGNRVFNLLYSLVSGYIIYDLGAGLNMYSVKALSGKRYMKHGNDLTFNYYMILRFDQQPLGYAVLSNRLARRRPDLKCETRAASDARPENRFQLRRIARKLPRGRPYARAWNNLFGYADPR